MDQGRALFTDNVLRSAPNECLVPAFDSPCIRISILSRSKFDTNNAMPYNAATIVRYYLVGEVGLSLISARKATESLERYSCYSITVKK